MESLYSLNHFVTNDPKFIYPLTSPFCVFSHGSGVPGGRLQDWVSLQNCHTRMTGRSLFQIVMSSLRDSIDDSSDPYGHTSQSLLSGNGLLIGEFAIHNTKARLKTSSRRESGTTLRNDDLAKESWRFSTFSLFMSWLTGIELVF